MMEPGSVMLATPAAGPPEWGYLDSLLGLVAPKSKYWVRRAHGLAVDLARNYLVNQFLEEGFDWLFFVDSDAVFHPQTLLRLMEWDEPVVGALCFTASKPTTPVVYNRWADTQEAVMALDETREWVINHKELHTNGAAVLRSRPDDALFPVAATGGHCLLINRVVLESMEPPWFKVNPKAGRGRGEDLYFFRKLGEAGFPAYVDLSVMAAHQVGRLGISALDFLAWDRITDWKNKAPTVR